MLNTRRIGSRVPTRPLTRQYSNGLEQAVRAVQDTQAAVESAPPVQQHALTQLTPRAHALTRPDLRVTKREWEVLQGICDGLNNNEIGQRVFLSENTVKTYCQKLYKKLGVTQASSPRCAAVAVAFRKGLVA